MDEIPDDVSNAILDVLKATLSPEGYDKAIDAMRVNHFLGEICKGHRVLNDRSYNFLLFGSPSTEKAWGWSLYGHHLCLNVYLDLRQMLIAPVFMGAEPTEIDEGPYKGTTMFRVEEAIGLKLMQSLPPETQQKAQIYEEMHDEKMPPGRYNEADQRHLCGAFQDNRQVPFEGVKVSEMTEHQIALVFDILNEFLVYLPEPVCKARLDSIRKYLDDTLFSWIGKYGDSDPFYYRIQSPVVVIEFDHHAGVFLKNEEPEKYHIHTIARAPNAGDYGNVLRAPEDRLE
jgi:hypothetical protein